jgi:hypothetical protein
MNRPRPILLSRRFLVGCDGRLSTCWSVSNGKDQRKETTSLPDDVEEPK